MRLKKTMAVILAFCLCFLAMPLESYGFEELSGRVYITFYSESFGTVNLVENGEVNPVNLDGVSYDISTNTLTLSGFNDQDTELMLEGVGDDFVIDLVGTNVLKSIDVSAYTSKLSLTFSGSGSLSVNESRSEDNALTVNAHGNPVSVTVSKETELDLYAPDDGSVIYINGTSQSDFSDILHYEGESNLSLKRVSAKLSSYGTNPTAYMIDTSGTESAYDVYSRNGVLYAVSEESEVYRVYYILSEDENYLFDLGTVDDPKAYGFIKSGYEISAYPLYESENIYENDGIYYAAYPAAEGDDGTYSYIISPVTEYTYTGKCGESISGYYGIIDFDSELTEISEDLSAVAVEPQLYDYTLMMNHLSIAPEEEGDSSNLSRVTRNGITYRILNEEKKTAVVVSSSKNIKTARIKNYVRIKKVKYKVTKIKAKAFAKRPKLKSVWIGGKVTVIGKKAFYNCSKLKSITIKSKKIKKIRVNAFKGIADRAHFTLPKKKVKKYKNMILSSSAG